MNNAYTTVQKFGVSKIFLLGNEYRYSSRTYLIDKEFFFNFK